MQLQARANKLAAGEQLLVIQVVHLEYAEIGRIACYPFVTGQFMSGLLWPWSQKVIRKRTESTAAVAFALTFSRPIYELSDEEMRIATTGQGRDVIE